MSFEFFLARRFLAGQRFGIFRLVTTVIAIGGTALGVAALLITLAVMDGFRTDIQEKILGTQPHVILTSAIGSWIPQDITLPPRLLQMKDVQSVAPFISLQCLLQSHAAVTGILLRGIDPVQEAKVTRIGGILKEGSWAALNDQSVILGQELARSVEVRVGDKITLVAPQQEALSWGQPPRMRQYTVVGIFQSGMYEYDANLAYVSLDGARELVGMGPLISGYGLRLLHLDAAPNVASKLRAALEGALWVRTWQDLNKSLFSAMRLERTVMFLILTLIILVSAFTIISNLLLLTIEKAREIGILQALGASPRQIGRVFLLNGLLLGGTGVALGLFLGVGLSWLLKRYPLIQLPSDVYYVDRLPVRLSSGMVGSVAVCAIVLVLISILYPAWKASRMDPVSAIRYG